MATVAEPQTDEVNAEGRARQRVTMRDMQRRLVAHLAAGRTTDFAEAPMEIDPAIYTDPARFEAERRALFQRLPLVAGLSCDIPEPGDMMTFDAAGPPILITRGNDGEVRAFLNACRHRGARVVSDCSPRKRMTCPFHGWTYDLEGTLVGMPGKEAFEGLAQNDLGLTPVPVAEWCGLIFVIARAGNEPIDVEAYMGPMADEVRQLDLARTAPVKKEVLDVAANWKFAQDTFFESYHFSTLHPTTISAHAFGNVMIHDQFGRHVRVMVPQRFWQDWIDFPEEKWPHLPYQGIHLLFPNTILFSGNLESMEAGSTKSSQRQIFGVWRIFPGDIPGKSSSMMATYRPQSQSSEQARQEYADLTDYILKVIQTEDYALCAQGQKNLNAAPKGHKLYFGRNESALHAIHQHINDELAAA
jgi:phenylpropionate dioxygenase-like ring-hydroxylating dioxygenase large terminal subunit